MQHHDVLIVLGPPVKRERAWQLSCRLAQTSRVCVSWV
jgi:hypothetical protein